LLPYISLISVKIPESASFKESEIVTEKVNSP
jgi:hypothetical protein